MNQAAADILAQFNEGAIYPAICDKCGQIVSVTNSATVVHEIATDSFIGFVKDRHLFPEGTCPGSPSRVKLVQSDPAWAAAHNWMQHILK